MIPQQKKGIGCQGYVLFSCSARRPRMSAARAGWMDAMDGG